MDATTSDITLILRLREGDQKALFTLYDRYSGALYGVALKMCRDQTLAQDLLQETFIKIWQKIDTYDPDKGKFYTWAYRITRNTALNALRKSSPLIHEEDLGVYEDTEQEETKDYGGLNGVLNKLEPHHQTAINLVYFKGYTHREAHEKMGVPLGTFKSYVRQALRKLREFRTELYVLSFYLEVFLNG